MILYDRIKREANFLHDALSVLKRIKSGSPDSDVTTADIVEHWARARPRNIAVYFEDRKITYKELDEAGNKYAHWAQDRGVAMGDVVAVLMENRPEFIMAWLGLAKIGAVAALINSNLRSRALAHCLKLAGARNIVLGAECVENFESAAPLLDAPPMAWTSGGNTGTAYDLDRKLVQQSSCALPDSTRKGLTGKDTCFYIYTSGTTGLPKAAKLTHMRVANIMNGFSGAAHAKETDRMYVTLPLYHSSGGIAAVGTTLTVGGAVIIKQQFSAREFWSDCVKYEATLFQYVGELCRYLLDTPETPDERRHRIRLCVGNGLRRDIWEKFQKRFRLPKILEFYGATEGNVILFNFDGKAGAIGRLPRYFKHRYRYALIKIADGGLAPVRGKDGLCVEVGTGEAGECLGEITNVPRTLFDGYSSREDSEKKLLRDVLKHGDIWFRTGDLMKMDDRGYFYFVDRIGDTFRWKGENVSTSEVAEVISTFDGIGEVNVYGVEVPRSEGRACMAAIRVDGKLDMGELYRYLEMELPDYARPLFLRMQSEIDVTSTFKHRKSNLVEQGFDPAAIDEPLYFQDSAARAYAPLDEDIYRLIETGRLRF